MNTTVTHVVEGTDLPSYESGLTDSGYLHMGRGVKLTIADRHVEYLRQLGHAVEGALQLLDATHDQPESVSCDCQTDAPESELQHPGTWLPGDQVVDCDGDTWTRQSSGAWTWVSAEDGHHGRVTWFDEQIDRHVAIHDESRITHLVPRSAGA